MTMQILFDVDAPQLEQVAYDGETFDVFGHVMIVVQDEATQTLEPVDA